MDGEGDEKEDEDEGGNIEGLLRGTVVVCHGRCEAWHVFFFFERFLDRVDMVQERVMLADFQTGE